jgi:hypothetical protein
MPFDGEIEICWRHPAAVVDDPDELLPAPFNGGFDAGGPSIKRVFKKLLERGSRAFDDLARCDSINKHRIKTADRHERKDRKCNKSKKKMAQGWTHDALAGRIALRGAKIAAREPARERKSTLALLSPGLSAAFLIPLPPILPSFRWQRRRRFILCPPVAKRANGQDQNVSRGANYEPSPQMSGWD